MTQRNLGDVMRIFALAVFFRRFLGGIPFAAHGAQFPPPPLIFLFLLFMLILF